MDQGKQVSINEVFYQEPAVRPVQIKGTQILGDKLFAMDENGEYWVSEIEFLPLPVRPASLIK